MLTIPCLCSAASAVLLTLPRVVRIALELGLNREAAIMVWQVCVGGLWPRRFGLLRERR
jgi:hypothetical protein